MFSKTVLFDQDISCWNVAKVTTFRRMFDSASLFCQDLSCWNVAVGAEVDFMFHSTVLEAQLLKCCHVSSFFYGAYGTMSCNERLEVFSSAFAWNRRLFYVLFLVGQGYMAVNHTPFDIKQEGVPSCDILFEVEDMSRYICKFL